MVITVMFNHPRNISFTKYPRLKLASGSLNNFNNLLGVVTLTVLVLLVGKNRFQKCCKILQKKIRDDQTRHQ